MVSRDYEAEGTNKIQYTCNVLGEGNLKIVFDCDKVALIMSARFSDGRVHFMFNHFKQFFWNFYNKLNIPIHFSRHLNIYFNESTKPLHTSIQIQIFDLNSMSKLTDCFEFVYVQNNFTWRQHESIEFNFRYTFATFCRPICTWNMIYESIVVNDPCLVYVILDQWLFSEHNVSLLLLNH